MLRTVALTILALLAANATAGNALDVLVAKDPVAEAEKAFSADDKRHIVVPVCGKEPGEVIPGWPLEDSPQIQSAMKLGRRPLTCVDLGNDPKRRNFMRAVQYAERYNRKLLDLENKK